MISELAIPPAPPTPVTPDKVATLKVLNVVKVPAVSDSDVALPMVVSGEAVNTDPVCRFAEM